MTIAKQYGGNVPTEADDPRLAIVPWLRELIDASRAARGVRVAQYGQSAGASEPEGSEQ